jgi:hypothetical protein
MSDNVIPFNNGDEESESCCEFCDLTHEYLHYVLDTLQDGSIEDLYDVLRGLVDEAGKLMLIDYLKQEVESKFEMLDHLHGYHEE